MVDIKKTYDALVTEARSRNLPCKIKRCSTNIIIEVGMDCPEEIDEKVFDTIEAIGMHPNDNSISICAESYGETVIESTNIAGGSVNYRARNFFSSGLIKNISVRRH